MHQQHALDRAKQIRLDFDGDVLVFAFRNRQGEEWEGALEEWIGNNTLNISSVVVRQVDSRKYVPIGSSGGGADLVLLRDDGTVCYLNDFDQQVSEVAASVDDFVSMLRSPS